MVDGGHVFLRSFVGVYSPLTGPILEGPRGHNPYCCVADLTDTRLGVRATTQPPDPTLPSRAHHQDYVSRTTSSNYNIILQLFLQLFFTTLKTLTTLTTLLIYFLILIQNLFKGGL